MLWLGLDSGTTTCKGLVLDASTGKVLAKASTLHSFIEGLWRGHVEQYPQIWAHASERMLLTCLKKIGDRTGLGIEAKELRITGGGARSASMRQIVADTFGLPVIGFKVAEGVPPWCCDSGGRELLFRRKTSRSSSRKL